MKVYYNKLGKPNFFYLFFKAKLCTEKVAKGLFFMLNINEGYAYIPVNQDNLEQYYYDWDGNLYYKDDDIMKRDGKYWIVDGFDLEDLRAGLENGVKLIFIYGSDLPPFLDDEVLDV